MEPLRIPVAPASAAPGSRAEDARALLRAIAQRHPKAVLAASFGAEDMVLVHVIADEALPIRIVTLDTGRLPQETHDLIDRTRERYRVDVEVVFPDAEALASHVRVHGSNAFYASPSLRERCCAIRKLEPLARALAGADAWITGLRRAQGVTRGHVAVEAFDPRHGIAKFSPLAEWTDDDVWDFLRARAVPYNALHDRGYPSIGCAPCTRPVAPGEDRRAGRWWWERAEHRECGLHRRPGQDTTAITRIEP